MPDHLPPVESLFDLQNAEVAWYPAGAVLGPRLLSDYEIVMLISGSAMLTLDDQRISLVPGSCVLARPGMTDSYRWDPERTSRHYFIHFGIDAGVDKRIDPREWPVIRHWPQVAVLAPLFRQLVWLGDVGTAGAADPSSSAARSSSAVARGYLWVLLASFLTGRVQGAEVDRIASEPLEAAVNHIRRRWENDGLVSIGRRELAAAAKVSEAHLSRLFTGKYGVGPVAGMEWVRLARARALVEKSSMTLGSVARACGFADQYHLSHRFSARFGYPPSRLRTRAGTSSSSTVDPQLLTLERVLLSGR